MKREGWERELTLFVEDALRNPTYWGCLTAARWAETATGCAMPKALTSVKTVRGAVTALKRYSGGSVLSAAEKIADKVGASEVPVKRAQRGDILAFEGEAPFDAALGVCVGADAIVMFGGETVAVPKDRAFKAWRL